MGQTRVDLLHLLEDLRDAYPGGLEETIVAETVANALDSGARVIAFTADTATRTLTILDDGGGMTRAQLRRYHDLAASTKKRGRGIGFAGVGIKLALLACDEVVTESRRAGRAYATRWELASRHRAPWEYVKPVPGLVTGDAGTAVRLALTNPLSPLLDPGWLAATLVRGFAPLFDPTFDEVLAPAYPDGVRFSVNGRLVPRAVAASARLFTDARLDDRADIAVRLPRKRKPSAVGWIARTAEPLPEPERGIAIATLGKVIRRGWDWTGVTPAAADRITGLIEAPGLSEALQLNKADFIRSGSRGGVYLAYRKAVQEGLGARLAQWGEPEPAGRGRRPRTRRIERDLEDVLLDLADDYPLLGALVEHRAGGQKRIPVGRADGSASAASWAPASTTIDGTAAGGGGPGEGPASEPPDRPTGAPGTDSGGPAVSPGSEPAAAPGHGAGSAALPGRPAGRRRGRYALSVAFERHGAERGMARLVESTVVVNEDHPAWRRAEASRAEGVPHRPLRRHGPRPSRRRPRRRPRVHRHVHGKLGRGGKRAGEGEGTPQVTGGGPDGGACHPIMAASSSRSKWAIRRSLPNRTPLSMATDATPRCTRSTSAVSSRPTCSSHSSIASIHSSPTAGPKK